MNRDERERLEKALEARGVEFKTDAEDDELYSLALAELSKPPHQGPQPRTFDERADDLIFAANDEGIAEPTVEAQERLGLVPRPDKPHVFVTGQRANEIRERMVASAS